LHNPQLLILDEPVANLDPISREAVWKMLDEWRHETQGTAIICSHVLSEMDHWATDYAIIDCGQVLKSGENPGIHRTEIDSSQNLELTFESPVACDVVKKALRNAGIEPSLVTAKGETLSDIYRSIVQ